MIRGGIVGGYYGARSSGRTDQDINALIAAARDIRDGRNGLPAASRDQFGQLWEDGKGNLYVVEEHFSIAEPASGTWSQYANSNFDGSHGATYHGTHNHYYYDFSHHAFYRILYTPGGPGYDAFYAWRRVTPETVLGANTIWLGEFDSEFDALHAIMDYDSTKTYYAFFDHQVRELDGSTYVAPVDRMAIYRWVRIGNDGVNEPLFLAADRSPETGDRGVGNRFFLDTGDTELWVSDAGNLFEQVTFSEQIGVYRSIGDWTIFIGTTLSDGRYEVHGSRVDIHTTDADSNESRLHLARLKVGDMLKFSRDGQSINRFLITSAPTFSGDVFSATGTWQKTFSGSDFTSLPHRHELSFLPRNRRIQKAYLDEILTDKFSRTIWSGNLNNTDDTEVLNVGETFSAYDILSFRVGSSTVGHSAFLVLREDFESRNISLYIGGNWVTVEHESDTQWGLSSRRSLVAYRLKAIKVGK